MSMTSSDAAQKRRQRWLSVLSKASADRLEALWRELGSTPPYGVLREPEIGLVMLQGRISGSGAPFAAGEMTVTRAAVRLPSGELGIGYVGGRKPRQAELAAALDALGQTTEWQQKIENTVIAPLAEEAEGRRGLRVSKAAATRVEFFTVAREAGTRSTSPRVSPTVRWGKLIKDLGIKPE
jgi:alpha-D-ribose 1-methylphosphonate 5-triphosphate synthase subunit PhnG